MFSRFLVTVCKMCRSNKENVNCLVFLTLFCINMRCWIKLGSDCIPSWRRQPLDPIFVVDFSCFSFFSQPRRARSWDLIDCRLAPASFSISPSNEYSGLSSFRIDWLDLLAVQGSLKGVFSSKTVQKHEFFSSQPSLWSNSHIHQPRVLT